MKIESDEKKKLLERGVVGPEEAIARIGIEMLYPTGDNLKMLSDLTPKEVFYLTSLNIVSNFYDSDVMKNFVENFLEFRMSRLRLGRKEMLIFATGLREAMEEKKRGVKSLLAGLE
ncbi:MAG: hypothetical protein ACP5F8_03610 [Candidatus Aenigmatarchaeota archaeon]